MFASGKVLGVTLLHNCCQEPESKKNLPWINHSLSHCVWYCLEAKYPVKRTRLQMNLLQCQKHLLPTAGGSRVGTVAASKFTERAEELGSPQSPVCTTGVCSLPCFMVLYERKAPVGYTLVKCQLLSNQKRWPGFKRAPTLIWCYRKHRDLWGLMDRTKVCWCFGKCPLKSA